MTYSSILSLWHSSTASHPYQLICANWIQAYASNHNATIQWPSPILNDYIRDRFIWQIFWAKCRMIPSSYQHKYIDRPIVKFDRIWSQHYDTIMVGVNSMTVAGITTYVMAKFPHLRVLHPSGNSQAAQRSLWSIKPARLSIVSGITSGILMSSAKYRSNGINLQEMIRSSSSHSTYINQRRLAAATFNLKSSPKPFPLLHQIQLPYHRHTSLMKSFDDIIGQLTSDEWLLLEKLLLVVSITLDAIAFWLS